MAVWYKLKTKQSNSLPKHSRMFTAKFILKLIFLRKCTFTEKNIILNLFLFILDEGVRVRSAF